MSSRATSGAATQSAVLPMAGGEHTSLRPTNKPTGLQSRSQLNRVK